jgi:hypothetical protein
MLTERDFFGGGGGGGGFGAGGVGFGIGGQFLVKRSGPLAILASQMVHLKYMILPLA